MRKMYNVHKCEEIMRQIIYTLDRDPSKEDNYPFYKVGDLLLNEISRDIFIFSEFINNKSKWDLIGNIPEGVNIHDISKSFENLITCTVCGLSKKKLEEHHIDKNRKNNNKKNLTKLCSSCHHSLHAYIDKGLSPKSALKLVKKLGRITAKKFGYNYSGLDKDEQIDKCIRKSFSDEGIDIPPKFLGFHSTKKYRIYCDVTEHDYEYVKEICKKHKMYMKDLVYRALFHEIKRLEVKIHKKLKGE